MKIYQIVIKGDKRSEAYAEVSRASFQPAIDAGIIDDIIVFDAITPESSNFEEHINRFNFTKSLMNEDAFGKPDDHSPTEKAGMCSHWELMKKQGIEDERFFIAEHDTFLHEDQLDNLKEIMEYIDKWDPGYANIGLFMGFYSVRPDVAHWMYSFMTRYQHDRNAQWPINCGPYGNIQRLYRTWCSHHPSQYHRAIHPWNACDTLYFGDNIGQAFNMVDPDKKNSRPNPTTQMMSAELKVTQDHHGYRDEWRDEPWMRCALFKMVDIPL